MRQLILMRHAKTEQAVIGQSDFDRELTDRGRLDAPLVAAQLTTSGAQPTLALVSDAVRAQQTWDLVRHSFPDCGHRKVSALYLAEAETIIREAMNSGQDRVLVIGHNPGLHELAGVLADDESEFAPELRQKFPTSGAAMFERDDAVKAWRLSAFVQARDLRD